MNTSKNWLWILIIIVVLALLWAAWQYEEGAPLSGGDTTAEIDKDLNAVDLGDPEEDLKQLDADLNQL